MIEIDIPSSKSMTHRALILASLSDIPCSVVRPLLADDTRATLRCLAALGAQYSEREGRVQFAPIDSFAAPKGPLDCGNSGTTLRLLMAQAARLSEEVAFTGDESLCRRPNHALLSELCAHGAQWTGSDDTLPGSISGPITSGRFHIDASVSSQYVTSLLLSLPLLNGDSVVALEGEVVSRPYIALTTMLAAHFGLRISHHQDMPEHGYRIEGGQRPRAEQVTVEGDWSTAAFPLIASVLSGRPVRLWGLNPGSIQGDRSILESLARFGQAVSWRGEALEVEPQTIAPVAEIELSDTPDMFPALAMLAAVSPGPTRLFGAAHLRHKESDRISAIVNGLRAVGIQATEVPDGAVIHGGTPCSGAVDSLNDHRILMAFECLGIVSEGGFKVSGQGHEAVSYPSFYSDLAQFR